MKVNLKMSVPKFVCFENVEIARYTLLREHSKSDSLISVGQFIITDADEEEEKRAKFMPEYSSTSSMKGRFVIVF